MLVVSLLSAGAQAVSTGGFTVGGKVRVLRHTVSQLKIADGVNTRIISRFKCDVYQHKVLLSLLALFFEELCIVRLLLI